MEEEVHPESLPPCLGLWRESGMGRVLMNPKLLSGERPVFDEAVSSQPPPEAKKPAHALIGWLENALHATDRGQIIHDKADELVRALIKLYPSTALFEATDIRPPGRTQWGRVRELAMDTSDGKALMDALFGDNGPMKRDSNNKDWNAHIFDEQDKPTTIRDWLKARLGKVDAEIRSEIVALMAQGMADALAGEVKA